MFHKWMFPSFLLTAIIIVAIIGFIFIPQKASVPKNFAEARISSALLAGSLNNFASESISALNKIGEKDDSAQYEEALDLTIHELERIRLARVKTIELLGELETMASSIPMIANHQAQTTGIRAISTKITLVDRLLNYNEKTKQLLDLLRQKFTSYSPEQFNEEVVVITQSLNDEALAINELNRKYQSLMKEFDERTR